MRLFLLALVLLLWPLAPQAARATQEQREHAQSVVFFAERRDWQNARIHAAQSGDEALEAAMQWFYLLDADSGASFDEINHFMRTNPGWPEQRRLRVRAELAMRDAPPTEAERLVFFDEQAPLTGIGRILLAEAKAAGGTDPDAEMIRQGWIQGDFNEFTELALRARYDAILTGKDDIARVDRLLWEEKTAPAKRLLPSLPSAQKKLFSARMALMQDSREAASAVAQVPSALAEDVGLLYERMRYRARKADHDGVRDLLLRAPENVPYPEKWWKFRERQARMAIDEADAELAHKLLANHGQKEGQGLADAIWLQGWLALDFLAKPQEAYDDFSRMYELVKFPVSRARAAYWAAQAAERMGQTEAASSWLEKAAEYPTAFYGQLAWHKRKGAQENFSVQDDSELAAEKRAQLDASLLARAITSLARLGALELASRLTNASIEATQHSEEAVYYASIGHAMKREYLSVRGAKKAQQRHNTVLLKAGYPKIALPQLPIEPALALAITRQESEFDPQAKSRAGALGYMQLLPSTARETARKIDMPYSLNRLYEPDYNLTVGSHYLSRLIDNYGGSYILAIAAYNAGPGNVRNWVDEFGAPGGTTQSAINWIEKIPFAETRNYVQRVLENLQIYRQLLRKEPTPLQLADDLAR